MIIVTFRKRVLFLDEFVFSLFLSATLWSFYALYKYVSKRRKTPSKKGNPSTENVINNTLNNMRGGDGLINAGTLTDIDKDTNVVVYDDKIFHRLTRIFNCAAGKTVISVTVGAFVAGAISSSAVSVRVPFLQLAVHVTNPVRLGKVFTQLNAVLIALNIISGPNLPLYILFFLTIITSNRLTTFNTKFETINTTPSGVVLIDTVNDNRNKIVITSESAPPVFQMKENDLSLKEIIESSTLGEMDKGKPGEIVRTSKRRTRVTSLKKRTKTLEQLKREISKEHFDEAAKVAEYVENVQKKVYAEKLRIAGGNADANKNN